MQQHMLLILSCLIASSNVAGMQLSGIGPAETLEEFGISVLADLPVGQDAHVRSAYQFPL
jgi:hypothetical protein